MNDFLSIDYKNINDLNLNDDIVVNVSLIRDYTTALSDFTMLNPYDDLLTTINNLNNMLSVFGILETSKTDLL